MYAPVLICLVAVGQPDNVAAQASETIIASLKQRLHQENVSSVRKNALTQAGQLGPAGEPLAPLIAEMLSDPDERIRTRAAVTLGRIGPKARSTAPLLAKALSKDKHAKVRAAAAEALGYVGTRSQGVVTSLVGALEADGSDGVRFYAAVSLGDVSAGSLTVVKACAAAVENDSSANVRAAAIRALGKFHRHPKHSLPVLLKSLDDTGNRHETLSAHVVGQKPIAADAATALGMFEKDAGVAAQKLTALMKNTKEDRTRVAAAVALIRISGPNDDRIGILCDVLRKPDRHITNSTQVEAAAGLSHLRKATPKALKCLQEALSDQSSFVRASAVRTLGGYGPDARAALPRIERLLKDDDEDVRVEARLAVEVIRESKSDN